MCVPIEANDTIMSTAAPGTETFGKDLASAGTTRRSCTLDSGKSQSAVARAKCSTEKASDIKVSGRTTNETGQERCGTTIQGLRDCGSTTENMDKAITFAARKARRRSNTRKAGGMGG